MKLTSPASGARAVVLAGSVLVWSIVLPAQQPPERWSFVRATCSVRGDPPTVRSVWFSNVVRLAADADWMDIWTIAIGPIYDQKLCADDELPDWVSLRPFDSLDAATGALLQFKEQDAKTIPAPLISDFSFGVDVIQPLPILKKAGWTYVRVVCQTNDRSGLLAVWFSNPVQLNQNDEPDDVLDTAYEATLDRELCGQDDHFDLRAVRPPFDSSDLATEHRDRAMTKEREEVGAQRIRLDLFKLEYY